MDVVSNSPITKPEELKAALKSLNMTRHEFAEALNDNGIVISPQAVWKWLQGKTARVPGYVGYFLLTNYSISKEKMNRKDC